MREEIPGCRGRALLVKHSSSRDDRIKRQLIERGVHITWACPADGDALPPRDGCYDLVVVYGGAQSANDDAPYLRAERAWIRHWVEGGGLFLGLCLGAQLLARAFGGRVRPHPRGGHEVGYRCIYPTPAGAGVFPPELNVYQWHKEGFEIPAGAVRLACGDEFPNQAFRYGERAYGLQFHPEVDRQAVRSWSEPGDHLRTDLGAHSPERQIADSDRYDAAVAAWSARFLDTYILSHFGSTAASGTPDSLSRRPTCH